MKKIFDVIISILIVLALGAVSGVAARGAGSLYESIERPFFAPPASVFGIVWAILYVMLGIIFYRLFFYWPEVSDTEESRTASNYFVVQLAINLLWTPIFFLLHKFWIAFLWIILLIGVAGVTFIRIRRFDKLSWRLSLPYMIWIIFAAILNFFIAFMN